MAFSVGARQLNGTDTAPGSHSGRFVKLSAYRPKYAWQLLARFRDSALTLCFLLQQRTTPAIATSFVRSYAADAKASPTEVSSILEQRIRGVQEEAGLAETGRVLSVG